MMLRQLMFFLVGLNCFMLLWTGIGMPGFGTADSYISMEYFKTVFAVDIVFGFIALVGAAAIANYSAIPFPNERSTTLLVVVPIFTITITNSLATISKVLVGVGLGGAAPLVTIIGVFVGLGILWTLIQWILGGGESIQ